MNKKKQCSKSYKVAKWLTNYQKLVDFFVTDVCIFKFILKSLIIFRLGSTHFAILCHLCFCFLFFKFQSQKTLAEYFLWLLKRLQTDWAARCTSFCGSDIFNFNHEIQYRKHAVNHQLSNTRALCFDDYFQIRSHKPAAHLIVCVDANSSSHFTRACMRHITPNRSKKHPMQPHTYLIDTSAAVKNIRCVKLEPLCSASVGRTPAVVRSHCHNRLLLTPRQKQKGSIQSACGRDEFINA